MCKKNIKDTIIYNQIERDDKKKRLNSINDIMHVFIYAIINNSNLNNYLAYSLLIIILITIPIFTYGNSELNYADYADEYDNV